MKRRRVDHDVSRGSFLLSTLLVGAVVAGGGVASVRGAMPVPLVWYGFNDAPGGTTATNSGSQADAALTFASGAVVGDDGSGITGEAGDRCYDGTGSTLAGRAAFTDTNHALDGFISVTVAVWFRANAPWASAGYGMWRLVDKGGFGLYANTQPGLYFQIIDANGLTTSYPSTLSYGAATNEWILAAASWDGTQPDHPVRFYIGSTTSSVKRLNIGTSTKSFTNTKETAEYIIGNCAAYNRAFYGLIDHVAVWGSKTNAAGVIAEVDLETFRQRTVPSFVPETPLARYDFNGTAAGRVVNAGTLGAEATLVMQNASGVATNLLGPPGSGVSGCASDRCLDLRGSPIPGKVGFRAVTAADINALDGLTSFTIAGWMKHPEKNPTMRMLSKGAAGYELSTGFNTLRLAAYLNGNLVGIPVNFPDWSVDWVFFAFTWDGTAANRPLKAYAAARRQPLSLLTTVNTSTNTSTTDTTEPLIIGNYPRSQYAAFDRVFAGELDNIAIWGSRTDASGVLDIERLDAYRREAFPTATVFLLR